MNLGTPTTIFFNKNDPTIGLTNVTGVTALGSIPAGGVAGFSAAGGVRFTFSADASSAAGISLFASFPTFPSSALFLQGTNELDLAAPNDDFTFSNITLSFSAATDSPPETNSVQFINETAGGGTSVVGTITDANIVNSSPVTFTGNFSFLRFTSSSSFVLKNIITTINCFCEGTRISTKDGFKVVEDLQAGDTILLADGGETEVKWLGQQTVDTRLSQPCKVNPIRVRAGALGDNLPERDLRISGDHAVALDGYLVNANALVNGTTITQEAEMPVDGFTYYHVETDAHDLILAEGVPAETYVDYRNDDAFDNAGERDKDRVIAEMPMPRISTARHLPDHIRRWLGIADAA